MRVAIIGAGPTGLLMFKKLIAKNIPDLSISIFERKSILGAGMPYSSEGACKEHITNVSGNEIPELVTSVRQWTLDCKDSLLQRFDLDSANFNDYKVLPRLLFGAYLSDQFALLLEQAKALGLKVEVHLNTEIADIIDMEAENSTCIVTSMGDSYSFERVIICSGHYWPKKMELSHAGYFDSPYPPQKIAFRTNHSVAIRGSSLTAIDAIRTLARSNGRFEKEPNEKLVYKLDTQNPAFKMTIHSRNGLLPAVRFHLEDSMLAKDSVLSASEVDQVRAANNGFVPLDYIYKRNFLDRLERSHPIFHALVKHLPLEKFVQMMMERRENTPAFELLRNEFAEARISIENQEPIYWKEMLAVLSFAMNYPAKYFSAEDMKRLKGSLMPLISVVIAFVPQSSVSELLALHQAGVLDIQSVGNDSEISTCKEGGINYHFKDDNGQQRSVHYPMFIDCIGQPHLEIDDLPYPSLVSSGTVAIAKLRFADQKNAAIAYANGSNDIIKEGQVYYLRVPGISINDNFQVLDAKGTANKRIHMLGVPFIGGYNPDYSGLDFGDAASEKVMDSICAGLDEDERFSQQISA
ncbi:FAD/NAD(P)-binding protein [Pedobacter boryungensis]|uniref:FAD/NAD(P)-binding protein n=1 Tax=Pedobacter boryungensis TaxID=869962 RepID=A0ABX2D905_9SPHI|nr:FAD/NAD(P)-binding protein [Pedobacter boryungensis]NQX30492.1 FAD/NAD(P)-binding protein [Pedobacter boryungensis]